MYQYIIGCEDGRRITGVCERLDFPAEGISVIYAEQEIAAVKRWTYWILNEMTPEPEPWWRRLVRDALYWRRSP
jgi:hypothetical protein